MPAFLRNPMAFFSLFMISLGLCLVLTSADLPRLEHHGNGDGTLNFLVVGDWGRRGLFNQSEVALQMGRTGKKLDINFVISTGDNFYDDGLTSVSDNAFKESFTKIYTAKSLQKQWYSVLGNHDYRGNVEAQLNPVLRKIDSRWLCLRSFLLNAEVAEFFFVDTTPMVDMYFTDPEDHTYDWKGLGNRKRYIAKLLKDVELALKESTAKWKIVVGHHAIRSIAHHGDTIELVNQLLPILQANNVDFYMNGHDHCLQHISDNVSNIQFLTSGGGSKAWRGDVHGLNRHDTDKMARISSSVTRGILWKSRLLSINQSSFYSLRGLCLTSFKDHPPVTCEEKIPGRIPKVSSSVEVQRFKHPANNDGTLSFLVVGDWGRRGLYNQSEVALQMGRIGEKLDINFVISTGDNFYDNGLTGVKDPAFEESFTKIYTAKSLQKQWYSVLGNHDYRGNAEAQLDPILRKIDSRWLCLRSFLLNAEVAEFFFVDTTPMIDKYFTNPKHHIYDWKGVGCRKGYIAKLLKDVKLALMESTAKWKIVVGHHAIRSVGHHGDTIELVNQLLPILQANNVDFYMNGHDHCLQHIGDTASNIQFLTSGAGSKAWRGTVQGLNQEGTQFFYNGQGFMSVQLSPNDAKIGFYDVFGASLHEWIISKQFYTNM
ncbi:hypothetical protein GIB67_006058 [Kingdonia uniflora]|uniref:acid phosphatase n=1 Tax=Kingdonia uniflora TaxID=39325 RepID=A0A7J7LPG9_9MAGN|nr:hypothetical protein GIB67_006058 [Kingdonia uniflora]